MDLGIIALLVAAPASLVDAEERCRESIGGDLSCGESFKIEDAHELAYASRDGHDCPECSASDPGLFQFSIGVDVCRMQSAGTSRVEVETGATGLTVAGGEATASWEWTATIETTNGFEDSFSRSRTSTSPPPDPATRDPYQHIFVIPMSVRSTVNDETMIQVTTVAEAEVSVTPGSTSNHATAQVDSRREATRIVYWNFTEESVIYTSSEDYMIYSADGTVDDVESTILDIDYEIFDGGADVIEWQVVDDQSLVVASGEITAIGPGSYPWGGLDADGVPAPPGEYTFELHTKKEICSDLKTLIAKHPFKILNNIDLEVANDGLVVLNRDDDDANGTPDKDQEEPEHQVVGENDLVELTLQVDPGLPGVCHAVCAVRCRQDPGVRLTRPDRRRPVLPDVAGGLGAGDLVCRGPDGECGRGRRRTPARVYRGAPHHRSFERVYANHDRPGPDDGV